MRITISKSAVSFEQSEKSAERKLKSAITKAKKELTNINLTLAEKISIKTKVKAAEEALRQFKLNYYAREEAYPKD